jgi:serine protease
VFPTSLNFGNFLDSLPIIVSNAGIGTLNVTSVTADVPWLTVSPVSGTAPISITVTKDITGLADGSYNGTVQVDTDATEGASGTVVSVAMTVGGVTMGDAGPILVQIFDATGSQIVAEVITDAAQGYAYSLPGLAPGTYSIRAGTDRDGDTIICDIEDACAAVLTDVTIDSSGTDVSDVNLLIVFGVGQPGPPVENE